MKRVPSREHPGGSRFYMVKSSVFVRVCLSRPCMTFLSFSSFHEKFVCLAENSVLVDRMVSAW